MERRGHKATASSYTSADGQVMEFNICRSPTAADVVCRYSSLNARVLVFSAQGLPLLLPMIPLEAGTLPIRIELLWLCGCSRTTVSGGWIRKSSAAAISSQSACLQVLQVLQDSVLSMSTATVTHRHYDRPCRSLVFEAARPSGTHKGHACRLSRTPRTGLVSIDSCSPALLSYRSRLELSIGRFSKIALCKADFHLISSDKDSVCVRRAM